FLSLSATAGKTTIPAYQRSKKELPSTDNILAFYHEKRKNDSIFFPPLRKTTPAAAWQNL
ncbi:MAG: hypothetical protein K2P48_08565, partial [Lachnospiraceae bacterium]|nr:hypothetical protein [Lachnospiraceae bacterium]